MFMIYWRQQKKNKTSKEMKRVPVCVLSELTMN